jgi:hypothetical protein
VLDEVLPLVLVVLALVVVVAAPPDPPWPPLLGLEQAAAQAAANPRSAR